MILNALVDVRVSGTMPDHCEDCPFGLDETCCLVLDAVGNGRARERDPDANLYYRTRACVAAVLKAGEVKE